MTEMAQYTGKWLLTWRMQFFWGGFRPQCSACILPETPAVVIDMTPNLKTLLRIKQRGKTEHYCKPSENQVQS